MGTISFWQHVETGTIWAFIIVLVALGLAFWLAFRVRDRSESKKQDEAFFQVIQRLHLSSDEQSRIVALVEQQQITRPVRVLKSLKEYDVAVEKEMKRLLTSREPWAARLKTFDKFYSVRDKILEFESSRR